MKGDEIFNSNISDLERFDWGLNALLHTLAFFVRPTLLLLASYISASNVTTTTTKFFSSVH